MITLLEPHWLLLLPAIAAAQTLLRRGTLVKPLRLIILALLVVALVRPELRLGGEAPEDLWLLMDRSASVADLMEKKGPEIENLVRQEKPDRAGLHIVDFGKAVGPRELGLAAESTFGNGSELRTALLFALAHADKDRPGRVLAVTDGYSTEPLDGLSTIFTEAKLPVDLRILEPHRSHDAGLASLEVPSSIRPGEPVLLEGRVTAIGVDNVTLSVTRNGTPLGTVPVDLSQGQGSFRLVDDPRAERGALRYQVTVAAPGDALAENNSREMWVRVEGGEQVLIVSEENPEPLRQILAGSGIQGAVVRPENVSAAALVDSPVVVLHNVGAYQLDEKFLKALPFFVTERGGGLLMIGGRRSFGAGGYFASGVDDLLPVSLELRREERRERVAMAIVLDRSGSMAAPAEGGLGNLTKMDLANEGAARSLELLADRDELAVWAVDSVAHEIVPLTVLGKDRDRLFSDIRSVSSGGGGIFVYEGLKAAWEGLKHATQQRRHIVLFADAADAEEPGDYKTLLAEMREAKASVSVIGLGSPADSDAKLLDDIGKEGEGRTFFAANAFDLPAVFVQETSSILQESLVETPVAVGSTGLFSEITQTPIQWPATVPAFNVTYPKPGASLAARTADERAAPLVAFWQKGLGRSAAVTFPLRSTVAGWPQLAPFMKALIEWLRGGGAVQGAEVRYSTRGRELEVELFYEDAIAERVASATPVLRLSVGGGKADAVPWKQLSPGYFRTTVELPPAVVASGAVQLGGFTLPVGPVTIAAHPEFEFDSLRREELRELVRASGGRERLDLTTVWEHRTAIIRYPFLPWLLVLALALALLEAYSTRMGLRTWQLGGWWSTARARVRVPAMRRQPISRRPPASVPVSREVADPPEKPDPAPSEPPPETGTASEERRSLFERAKRKGL